MCMFTHGENEGETIVLGWYVFPEDVLVGKLKEDSGLIRVGGVVSGGIE